MTEQLPLAAGAPYGRALDKAGAAIDETSGTGVLVDVPVEMTAELLRTSLDFEAANVSSPGR